MDETTLNISYVPFKNFTEFQLTTIGRESCKPAKQFGPYVRNCYVVHYILSGKGIFDDGRRVYDLCTGNAFLICPENISYYRADSEQPWEYIWFTFVDKADSEILKNLNLSRDNPIYEAADTEKMQIASEKLTQYLFSEHDRYSVLGAFFEFFGTMTAQCIGKKREKQGNGAYFRKAADYITANCHRNLRVSEVCASVGIERSYLYRIFRDHGFLSPKDYIIRKKMHMAVELLRINSLNVSQAACSVGYDDISAFSKQFKKIYGVSPREYRKRYIETHRTDDGGRKEENDI